MNNNKKIKIAVTAEFLCHSHFTGIENYLYNIVHSIASFDSIDLCLICPTYTPRSLLPTKATIYNHNAIDILGTKFISSLINPPKNLNDFEIIHCPTVVAPFFFNAGQKDRVKVVMTVHDLIPMLFPKFNIIRRRIYFNFFLKYRFRFVDHFIVPSESVKRDLQNKFSKDKGK